MRASRAASWSSPSIAIVAPWSASTARSVSAKATSGWNEPTCVPAAIAGASTDASRAPLVWTIAWPLYMWSSLATRATVSSGTATMISSTSSISAVGSANARLPSTRFVNRSRRAGSRLATALTGQAARRSATPSAVPTAPAPTMPMTGGSSPSVRTWGWEWSLAWTSSPCRWCPGGTGSRSTPAASSSWIVPSRSGSPGSAPAASAPAAPAPSDGAFDRSSPQAFTGRWTGPSAVRGTLPRNECTDHADGGRVPSQDQRIDPFGARASLGPDLPDYFRLAAIRDRLDLDRAPVTLKILVENALRHAGRGMVRGEDVEALTSWKPGVAAEAEVPFMPARVILQDFTGVPAVVDLAVMRDAMADLGGDPAKVNPLVPADLVIDHSVQVDRFGTPAAFAFNVEREYERNGERYQLLRWAQTAFRDFRVVPPGTGIVHQVNLEYLATVVTDAPDPWGGAGRVAYPDTLVGTDSHTTMINRLGLR